MLNDEIIILAIETTTSLMGVAVTVGEKWSQRVLSTNPRFALNAFSCAVGVAQGKDGSRSLERSRSIGRSVSFTGLG